MLYVEFAIVLILASGQCVEHLVLGMIGLIVLDQYDITMWLRHFRLNHNCAIVSTVQVYKLHTLIEGGIRRFVCGYAIFVIRFEFNLLGIGH